MKIMLASGPADVNKYLIRAGHEVINVALSELDQKLLDKYKPDVVVCFDTVFEPADPMFLKELTGSRLILATDRKDPNFFQEAFEMGLKEFVLLPCNPATIQYRISNPMTEREISMLIIDLESSDLFNEPPVRRKQAVVKEPDSSPQEKDHPEPVKPRDETKTAVNERPRGISTGRVPPPEGKEIEQIVKDLLTDDLTGLYRRDILKTRTLPDDYAVIMIDLDGLKKVNDSYGHHFGDQVLREFAQVFSSQIRSSDIAIRWGGDEFLVVLPGADQEAAGEVCKRIERTWNRNQLASMYGVGTSIGYACSGKRDFWEVVDEADRAMYASKRHKKEILKQVEQTFVAANGEDVYKPEPVINTRKMPKPKTGSVWWLVFKTIIWGLLVLAILWAAGEIAGREWPDHVAWLVNFSRMVDQLLGVGI